jgi:hypothetical protein
MTLAYSHSGAAVWADSQIKANACGVYHEYLCFNDDCTAFVSEALNAGGGYPQTASQKGTTTDDHYWYMVYQPAVDGYAWSYAWSVANDLPQYLWYDNPGGYPYPTQAGTSLQADSGVGTGDVLFYDWYSNGTMDHASIVVGYGPTADGGYGDYVDAHTETRYHGFWTLRSWNQHIQTTTIHPWYISSSN